MFCIVVFCVVDQRQKFALPCLCFKKRIHGRQLKRPIGFTYRTPLLYPFFEVCRFPGFYRQYTFDRVVHFALLLFSLSARAWPGEIVLNGSFCVCELERRRWNTVDWKHSFLFQSRTSAKVPSWELCKILTVRSVKPGKWDIPICVQKTSRSNCLLCFLPVWHTGMMIRNVAHFLFTTLTFYHLQHSTGLPDLCGKPIKTTPSQKATCGKFAQMNQLKRMEKGDWYFAICFNSTVHSMVAADSGSDDRKSLVNEQISITNTFLNR